MLAGLNVTTGGQPQPRVDVIDEEHVVAIHDSEVGDEVLRRNVRFPQSTNFNSGIDPVKNVNFGYPLKFIKRLNELNLVSYHSAHSNAAGAV